MSRYNFLTDASVFVGIRYDPSLCIFQLDIGRLESVKERLYRLDIVEMRALHPSRHTDPKRQADVLRPRDRNSCLRWPSEGMESLKIWHKAVSFQDTLRLQLCCSNRKRRTQPWCKPAEKN